MGLCPTRWQLLVSSHSHHPCSTCLPLLQPCHIKLIPLYAAKQEGTRRESLYVFLVAAREVLHEATSGVPGSP